jgi:hypothetical protein
MSNLFFKGSRESVLLPLVAECLTATGGKFRVNFKVRYRCPTQDERREMAEAAGAGSLNDDDCVERLIQDWQDVKDAQDEPILYNEENLKAAMQEVPYRNALVEGALTMIYGKQVLEAVRQKNSRKPGATG